MNEKTYITSNESLTAETNYITTFSLYNKTTDIIKTEPVSNPYTKHILISNSYVDDNAQ